MARKIWDPEKKMAADSAIMEETIPEPDAKEKTPEEKFDEMIRGEYRDIFLERVKKIIAEQKEDTRTKMADEKHRRARENIARQIEQAKTLYSEFDLANEMKNPHFSTLVRSGVDFVTAYEIAHKDELMTAAMAYAARRAAKSAADSIQTRAKRTGENGISAHGSARTRARSVSDMTREERDALMRRAMNGERIVL